MIGKTLGHYQITETLGEGGMGVVYRAQDARLDRNVAVKVLPAEFASDPDRLRRFEHEAKAVAALNHPNILTVHDVGTEEGTPYVVMELLEGENFREVLSRRAPTLRQVLSFAVQIARGLSAAHQKGIVHRDLKPENLFVTTDGRVKILDFGLAKLMARPEAGAQGITETSPTQSGLVMGTVPYMSPEQVRGLPLDHRSDIFSLGVVLYELLTRRHPFRKETVAATLTAIIEDSPAELSNVDRAIPPAVSGIVRRCLEKSREDRFQGAQDLASALEALVGAPAGSAVMQEIEERRPYPGLQSFTEKDAPHFFGREEEVKALWQRLQNRKLLAVIGPSGTGKTSFVRAGLIPTRPGGWAGIVCTPGNAPVVALGRALARELAADPDALQDLVRFDEPDVAVSLFLRWRRMHEEGLVVVDQFEELFTLNPTEAQARFASIVGRLASEADVHILISLRDDFLMRSQEHPPLRPILGELTALLPLSAQALRRVIEEPSKKLGYRFEDEALVDEMVESVEGARAALPLLAFAVSRLWEKRDRERKLLTRAAYEEIGGVAGALAQHAEAVMDRIGVGQDVVREIFRNLVTAQGTRAVVDRDELLSAFPEKTVAETALRELIDARLVTSYEVERREGEERHHRVEVVHESLLKAWPRLVWWQTQDEEGAVLRDQLKQAAHLWQERGRPADLLWSGTSFREYELWRERYTGALTALEEDFARSMAGRARRRRRLMRLAVAAAFVLITAIAIVIGFSRLQATRARDQAKAEARRAEAGKLLALGRTQLDTYPTAALAYVRKSLELADTLEARRFAVEVLWRGPTARILPVDQIAKQFGVVDDTAVVGSLTMSPDGNWLATLSYAKSDILVFQREGGPPKPLPHRPTGNVDILEFSPRSEFLIIGGSGSSLELWSLPDLREIRSVELERGLWSRGGVRGEKLFTLTMIDEAKGENLLRAWPLPDGDPEVLGTFKFDRWDIDADGRQFAYVRDRIVRVRSLEVSAAERVLGNLRGGIGAIAFFPKGDRIATVDRSGEISLWSLAEGATGPSRILRGPKVAYWWFGIDPEGSRLAGAAPIGYRNLWNLNDPPDAEPAILKRPDVDSAPSGTFDPTGRWLVSGSGSTVTFWPLSNPSVRKFRVQSSSTWEMSFTADGRWLVSCPMTEPARLWPISPAEGTARNLLPPEPCWGMATHPKDASVLIGAHSGKVLLYQTDGGPPHQLLAGWEGGHGTQEVAFDSRGRRAAAAPLDYGGLKDPKSRILRVWDLESGQDRVFSVAHLTDDSWPGFEALRFAPDGSLFAAGRGGIRRLVFPAAARGTVMSKTVYATGWGRFALSRDGQHMLAFGAERAMTDPSDELVLFDLAKGTSCRITTHGRRLFCGTFDPSGQVIVTGDHDGIVRAGPITGEEPHLLLGHNAGTVSTVAISPDGRWIASVTDEGIHLWPMPDVTKPPLHTLPYDELMAKLLALTNLQVVEDKTVASGWRLDIGPFPGWKDVPTW